LLTDATPPCKHHRWTLIEHVLILMSFAIPLSGCATGLPDKESRDFADSAVRIVLIDDNVPKTISIASSKFLGATDPEGIQGMIGDFHRRFGKIQSFRIVDGRESHGFSFFRLRGGRIARFLVRAECEKQPAILQVEVEDDGTGWKLNTLRYAPLALGTHHNLSLGSVWPSRRPALSDYRLDDKTVS